MNRKMKKSNTRRDNKGGNRNGQRQTSRSFDRSKFTGTRDGSVEGPDANTPGTMPGSSHSAVGGNNHLSWYTFGNETLLKDIAENSFPFATGTRMNYNQDSSGQLNEDAIAGLMRIRFIPTIGCSYDNDSPVNMAAKSLFTYLRSRVNGSRGYETPDMMLAILALTNVHVYHAYIRRIYGMMSKFKLMNTYVPEAWFESAHIDYQDLKKHIKDLQSWLNWFAKAAQRYPLPNVFSIADRYLFLTDRVFLDNDTTKSQLYYFTPDGFYSYEEAVEGKPGHLKYNMLPWNTTGSRATFDELVDFGNNLLSKIEVSEDVIQMSSDLLAVYGVDKLRHLPYTEADYSITFDYDPSILIQIENCMPMGRPKDGTLDINQDVSLTTNGGALVQKPVWEVSTADAHHHPALADGLINFHVSSPGPGDIMYATRLLALMKAKTSGSKKLLTPTYLGSEVVLDLSIWYKEYNSTSGAMELTAAGTYDSEIKNINFNDTTSISDATKASEVINFLSKMSQFRNHPGVWVYVSKGNTALPAYRMQEIDNYTFITADKLEQINRVAMLSMFGAPELEF